MNIWAKMYKILKYFEKGQVTVCYYRTQQTARKGPQGKNYDPQIILKSQKTNK